MIRAWLRGQTDHAPFWVAILEAAETWSMSPWTVEEQASEVWWHRWRVYREESAAYQKHQAQKGK